MKCINRYLGISTNPLLHLLPRKQLEGSLRNDLRETLAHCFDLQRTSKQSQHITKLEMWANA